MYKLHFVNSRSLIIDLHLNEKTVIIVGAGNEALKRTKLLENEGCKIIVIGEKPLFNPDLTAGWQDFELHVSEETKLVVKILQLAGVAIKDYNLSQAATQKDISKIQQEKQ